MGNLFVMVTLKKSNIYTVNALKSFFKYTKLEENDEFFLIDNDNSENNQFSIYDKLKIINNKKPLSFAENVNQSIDWAIKKKKNLIFLSNDIIFTNNWFRPLSLDSENISMPSNNQIFQYESDFGILKLRTTMKIEDFNNNYELLDDIIANHKKKIKSGQKFQTLLMALYCFKIPLSIIDQVGYFDTSYGTGGGEDIDFRIKCTVKGYHVNYLSDSYLLHFHGKSTWDIETNEQTAERNKKYIGIFKKKWGYEMTQVLILRNNFLEILKNKDLLELYKKNNFSELIKRLI